MKNCRNKIIFFLFLSLVHLNAEVDKIDLLLEKVKQATTHSEKKEHLQKLKEELFKINKKTREDASAIIKAKKKVPSKSFEPEKIKK